MPEVIELWRAFSAVMIRRPSCKDIIDGSAEDAEDDGEGRRGNSR